MTTTTLIAFTHTSLTDNLRGDGQAFDWDTQPRLKLVKINRFFSSVTTMTMEWQNLISLL